jgi:hypothetical protein
MCAAINSSTNQTVSAVMEDLHQCYSGFRASLVPALLHTLASESILSKLNACLTLISSVNSDNLTVAECQSLFACLSGLAERAIAAVTKMTTGFPSATDAEITLLACQLRALFHLQKYFNSVEQPIAAKLTVSSSSWLRLILRCFDMSMAGESCCPLGEPQLTQEQSAVQLCLAGDDSGGRGIDWDDEILRQALFQLAEFAMDRLLCAADTLDNRMALLNIFDDWLVRNRLSAESSQLLQSSYLKVLVMLERLAPSLVEFSQLVGRFCELLLSNQAAGSVPYGFLRFVERQYLSNNRGEMANILPILKNNLPSLLCLSTDSLLVKSEKIRLLTKLTIAIDTVDIAFLICKQLWDYTLDPELAAIAIKALTEIAIDSDAGQMEYAKDASIRMWIIEQFTGQLFADNPHLRNLIYGLCSK